LTVALSNGSNRVIVSLSLSLSLPSPDDASRSSFRNVAFSSHLEYRTMIKVHKPSDSGVFSIHPGTSALSRQIVPHLIASSSVCNVNVVIWSYFPFATDTIAR
jgi:hypothetical protein